MFNYFRTIRILFIDKALLNNLTESYDLMQFAA